MRNGLIIKPGGTKRWYKDDKLHREDGPAVLYPNGNKQYYRNGLLHRDDGPATIEDYEYKWYIHGKLHREDGPAVIHANGEQDWCLNNKYLGNKKPDNWDDLVKLAQVEMIMNN
jgi:hypothetical protein